MAYTPDYEYVPPADYHFLTKFYDFFCFVLGLGRGFKKKVLNVLPLRDGQGVLDVGCGTGILLQEARAKFPNCALFGIDPDAEALEIAKGRLAGAGGVADLKQGYAEALPFPDGTFDFCVSTLAFHHMPNEVKKKALSEMFRVLKSGGKVAITDFGQSNSKLLRLVLKFEEKVYVEGNLQGLIPQYMEETGFKNQKVLLRSFFNMQTLIAEKNLNSKDSNEAR